MASDDRIGPGANDQAALPRHVATAVRILARRVSALTRVDDARGRLAALVSVTATLAAEHERLLEALKANRALTRAAVRAYGLSLRHEGVRPEHRAGRASRGAAGRAGACPPCIGGTGAGCRHLGDRGLLHCSVTSQVSSRDL